MGINFKPINEVPVIEALADGDKVLVNSGGTAKQIDASLVGGGGMVIYIKDFTVSSDETTATGSPCKDAEMTQVMTVAELTAAFASGPLLLGIPMGDDVTAWATPVMSYAMGTTHLSLIVMGSGIQLTYTCADASA